MPANPKRGEVWRVNLEPTVGDEIRKTRPAVILSSDRIGKLNLRLIVPMTDWKDWYVNSIWMTPLMPSPQNGLSKPSSADAFQTRSVSTERFLQKLEHLAAEDLDEISAAIALVIELNA